LYKLNHKLQFRKSALFLWAALFCSSLQLFPVLVFAQGAGSDLLPDNPAGEWHAISRTRVLKSDEWSVLPDASVYSEYGLQRLHSRVYAKGTARATVEIFELRFPSGAYGLYTFNRGSLSPNRHEFHEGSYLVSIESGSIDKQLDDALAENIKKNFVVQSGNLPQLPYHLPQQNKIADSEKYLLGPEALARLKGFSGLKNVIKFAGGVEIVSADYQSAGGTMGLMIIEYQTPQTAADGYKAITKYLDSANHDAKENRILKRVGNYLVHAINVKDATEAGNLISQIKYDYKVYWEGRKMSDVPLEFRPPDPTLVEDANRTLMIMVRSLYWVGALMSGTVFLGLLAGGTFFYWRRYRRRKLGLDGLFSDAGGSIRLNLDDYLLEPRQSSVKQLGDGNS